jgi:hypothetical protein
MTVTGRFDVVKKLRSLPAVYAGQRAKQNFVPVVRGRVELPTFR